jgi:alpha-glucoside transport system substrate-binding protein
MGLSAVLRSRTIAIVIGAVLLAGCSTGGGTASAPGDISIWVAWGGAELKSFRDVLKPFETANPDVHIHITTNRDSTTQIANGIESGTELPDIAPGTTDPIQIKNWVSKGAMKPLETFMEGAMAPYMANTYPALVNAPGGAADDPYIGIIGGKHYMLMIKTQVKGLFWYNKKVFTGTAPKTFDDLLAINPSQYGAQKLFCAAIESGAASGWPASDQIDNIIMRQNDANFYTDWINGKVKFTDPQIKLGYQTYLKEVSAANVYGGSNTVLSTNFGKAGDPLFKSPPGCLFLEQATFIASFFTQNKPGLVAGTDFDFFGHPSMGNSQFDGNVNGFYDNLAVYNDKPGVRKLMQYLSTAPAQQIWADDGGTLGGIKSLTYKDPIFQRAAEVANSAKNLLVTAGDFMPSDMRNAFWKSLLDVTRDPGSLDSVLKHLDAVQAAAYKAA